MSAVTPTEVRTFDPAYRLFRAQLHYHLTRVPAIGNEALALFIIDHGDELPLRWGQQHRHNLTTDPRDYELFLRQQYLKSTRKA